MLRRPPFMLAVAAAVVTFVLASSGVGLASTPEDGVVTSPDWVGEAKDLYNQPRASVPEDRYAMAGGCYAIRAESGGYVLRTANGFAATGAAGEGEPFHFQATDLGKYLLFGAAEDYLAASEGLAAQAAYTVTRSSPGATVGGLVEEKTDQAAEDVADSDANKATGRGESIVAVAEPSDLADWKIEETGAGAFTLVLPETAAPAAPETAQALATGADGELVLAAPEEGSAFIFEKSSDCATFPEIEVNVQGPILGGQNSYQEVRGFIDAHLHMMAFEFIGGRVRCGRPWHRFGVAYALVDCPDHEPGGFGAVLEDVLSNNLPPGQGHNTDGWPTFEGWPSHGSLTHEQVYYKWLERAWRGGLRLVTNLLVDNNQLCKIYPFKRHDCNEMNGVRLQAKRIHELQDYIDAQNGGPGEGWFRIVTDPFEAREVINEGKLAVVLGIEVSVPLDCGIDNGQPRCTKDDIGPGLDEVYGLGVRQMELTNKFDNAFSGVTGDSGPTGYVVNAGNRGETGQFWQFETCPEGVGDAHDHTQMNLHDDSEGNIPFTERDGLVGGILAVTGSSGAVPIYPAGPHCNVLGLSDMGETMINGMIDRGMIFDPDHMSALARAEALDLVKSRGYSGVVSSHGWADDTIYPRVLKLGGVVTPHAGRSDTWFEKYDKHMQWQDDRYYFGLGFGSDMNGFSSQGGPPLDDDPAQVTYPFTLGGVTVDQQQSGSKKYDYGVDGVAHYGMYLDYIEHVRKSNGEQMVEAMYRSAEQYLQMWERAWGIAPDACRFDVDDLSDAALDGLQAGMTPKQVLGTLGQPSSRLGGTFTFCVDGARKATLTFALDDTLTSWEVL